MTDAGGKRIVRALIEQVWIDANLDAVSDYWTPDCVNHAAEPGQQHGLNAVRAYHAAFASMLGGLSNLHIDVEQQVEEGDRVVSQLLTRADHTGTFLGAVATGRHITLATIRIDRIADNKIAEHWSVADLAGLMTQLAN